MAARCVSLATIVRAGSSGPHLSALDDMPTMRDLAEMLDHLSGDPLFVAEVCASAIGSSREDVRNILDYAVAACEEQASERRDAPKAGAEDDTSELFGASDGLSFALDIRQRWQAFEKAFPAAPACTSPDFDVYRWQRWSQGTLVDAFADVSRDGNASSVIAFWNLCGSTGLATTPGVHQAVCAWPQSASPVPAAWLQWFSLNLLPVIPKESAPEVASWLVEHGLAAIEEQDPSLAVACLRAAKGIA